MKYITPLSGRMPKGTPLYGVHKVAGKMELYPSATLTKSKMVGFIEITDESGKVQEIAFSDYAHAGNWLYELLGRDGYVMQPTESDDH